MSDSDSTAKKPLLLRRLSSIELLIAISIFFISFPFIEPLRVGGLIQSILLTLVLASAVWTIAGKGWILNCIELLGVIALIGRWLNYFRPDIFPPEIFLIAVTLFVILVIANLLRFVLEAPSVTTDVLCAGISAYLLLGLLWTFVYWLIAELVPDAFAFNSGTAADASIKGFNGLYFSFITLSTVGYGDITPVAKVARMLAAAESTTGLLYVAVLIARLVAIHSTPNTNEN